MRAFWDASAVVPLCVPQREASASRRLLKSYPPVVWWGTPVEISSALVRLGRSEHLTEQQREAAAQRLTVLRAAWAEVQPTERVRALAERLLERHALRAADALQLAAALVWCNERPRGRVLLCRDARLSDAARREGFEVIP